MLGPVARWGLIATAIVVLLPVLTLTILSLNARRPSSLGLASGKLRPCPDTPNCVCSCDDKDLHVIAPLIWDGSAQEGLQRLARVMVTLPNARFQAINHDNYRHVEFTSAWFRFVDDVEFLVDSAAGVIHLRSASRVGRSDLGVNRKRVEQIRKLFEAGP